MLFLFAPFVVQAVAAVSFPPPTGPYHVGYLQHVFDKTTQNDPVAPANASSMLLATIYYPTLAIPVPGSNIAPYLDPTTAKLWGDNWRFPNNSLESLTTWNVYQAPTLDKTTYGISQKPTIIFSPGAGENAIMYNALNAELASQGHTVVALDHPGEAPYLQLPNGAQGVYGIDIKAILNDTLVTAIYHMRVSDTLATIWDLFPSYVESINAPFNTTHYFTVGHSLGGAAAAGALATEPSILGGVNFDGVFFDASDVKKPLLMLGQAAHTFDAEPNWPSFTANQSGWFQWLSLKGSGHQNFADVGDWVDLQGLRNRTSTSSLGEIWAPRMDYVVGTLVKTFLAFVLGEREWLSVPNEAFPEVEFVNGSAYAL
jgi:pimeloyl-ACP methyl ester carboxylesterase